LIRVQEYAPIPAEWRLFYFFMTKPASSPDQPDDREPERRADEPDHAEGLIGRRHHAGGRAPGGTGECSEQQPSSPSMTKTSPNAAKKSIIGRSRSAAPAPTYSDHMHRRLFKLAADNGDAGLAKDDREAPCLYKLAADIILRDTLAVAILDPKIVLSTGTRTEESRGLL
jgi:hypothetical protein